MTRQKQYKAIITDESYMEDLIWMSYRYCIGRHTIVSHSHAGDIAKYSFDHISENRKSFMAHDIRQEINDTLRWKNNIECRDYRNMIDKDALSIIIESLYEKYGTQLPSEDIWTKYKYIIENGVLNIERNIAAFKKYIEDNKLEITDFPRECYIEGIWNKENVEDWLTEIQVPIGKRRY